MVTAIFGLVGVIIGGLITARTTYTVEKSDELGLTVCGKPASNIRPWRSLSRPTAYRIPPRF